MQDLRVTLVQQPLYWHDITANLARFEELLWDVAGNTDVIVLPEMFQTGFTMDAALVAEPMGLTTFRWMKQLAAQTKALVMGSYIVKEQGHFFNRLLWMEPSGEFAHYDKRHLFRMADEQKTFTAGHQKLIKTWKGWRLCPMVCYDLRFPVWSRNTADQGQSLDYDVLFYVANWPAARVNAWDALLQARAIENLSYVVGVNRTGEDDKGIAYCGHSAVYSPRVERLWFGEDRDQLGQIVLSGAELLRFREKFPAYLDADPFTLTQ